VVVSSPALPAGQRVWFATSAGMAPVHGSLAEWCAVRAADLILITAEVSYATAAAVGTSGIAALMSLRWRAQLRAGERVSCSARAGWWVRWRLPSPPDRGGFS
jgi:NADPH:quinone reductase-like Zn-dependent oxidoreductase